MVEVGIQLFSIKLVFTKNGSLICTNDDIVTGGRALICELCIPAKVPAGA